MRLTVNFQARTIYLCSRSYLSMLLALSTIKTKQIQFLYIFTTVLIALHLLNVYNNFISHVKQKQVHSNPFLKA